MKSESTKLILFPQYSIMSWMEALTGLHFYSTTVDTVLLWNLICIADTEEEQELSRGRAFWGAVHTHSKLHTVYPPRRKTYTAQQ